MSQLVYRGNLGSSSFPFLSENFGRSIILKQFDQNFVPNINSAEDLDKDLGIPQLYYCHNVIANGNGFQSTGFFQRLPRLSVNESQFTKILEVRDATENRAFISLTKDGRFFVALAPTYEWISVPISGPTANREIYVAHIAGISYIFISGVGCSIYDFDTNTLIPVTLTGLSIPSIIGIVAAQGYLIAWSNNEIAWSSTIDPTDFVPSLVTGAGGGAVEGARGAITVCVPHTIGFIVYTTANAVTANYSGNARFPFNFRAISACGGCSSSELVSAKETAGSHWAYTTSGLQQVNSQAAVLPFPELTDFISGKTFEDFDENSLTFIRLELSGVMNKKLAVISDRYLIISYGITELTHAIVYDLSFKRFGKFKITHVDCFEWQFLSGGIDAPRESIGFLKKDGSVQIADLRNSTLISDGIMLLGKFQHIRQRLLTIQMADIENVRAEANFYLYGSASLNGKDLNFVPLYKIETNSLSRRYAASKVGINHTLLFRGAFNINSLVLYYTVHGRR